MKQVFPTCLLLVAFILFSASYTNAQSSNAMPNQQPSLKTFLIERDIPGAGQFTPADLKGISQKSCTVIKELGPGIVWLQSYVTSNKIFCVYQAENETLLKEHAKKGGFPITSISEINSTIGPETAK